MLAVSLFAIFATACSKDEKATPAGGSFSVDGKSYNSNYAYWNTANGLTITNIGVAPDYIENYVRVVIDTLKTSTYTFLSRANGAYDIKKNFAGAEIRYNATNVAGQSAEITGVTAGTITVTKSAAIYNISYTLTVGGKAVTGTYNGQVSDKPAGE